MIKVVKNIHLLLLSATPMYNDYKEIIWLLNLLNINDNRRWHITIILRYDNNNSGHVYNNNSNGWRGQR